MTIVRDGFNRIFRGMLFVVIFLMMGLMRTAAKELSGVDGDGPLTME